MRLALWQTACCFAVSAAGDRFHAECQQHVAPFPTFSSLALVTDGTGLGPVAGGGGVAGGDPFCLRPAAAGDACRPGLELHLGRCHEHRQCAGLPAGRAGHAASDAAPGGRALAAGGRFAGQPVHGPEWLFHQRRAFAAAAPAGRCGQRFHLHCRGAAGGASGRFAAPAQRPAAGAVLRWHRLGHHLVGLGRAAGAGCRQCRAARLDLGLVVFGGGLCGCHGGAVVAGAAPACPDPGAQRCDPAHRGVSLASAGVRAGGLRFVWGGLHRLHDVCDCFVA